jgi:arylsulfatase A-like enzyme
LLREGKGSTWEGGMRVPAIAWMPGRIKSGVTSEPASTLDLFPTALSLAGVELPPGITFDGADIAPLLFERKRLPKRPFFYYRGAEVFACGRGEWKAHFITQGGFGGADRVVHERPLLFHLGRDPSEQFNVADEHPEVLAEIRACLERHRAPLVRGTPQK